MNPKFTSTLWFMIYGSYTSLYKERNFCSMPFNVTTSKIWSFKFDVLIPFKTLKLSYRYIWSLVLITDTTTVKLIFNKLNLRGFKLYANFLTKFDKRTAKIITGNPISCTGISKAGSWLLTASGRSAKISSKIKRVEVEQRKASGCFRKRILKLNCWYFD